MPGSDNLISALCYQMKKLEEETKVTAERQYSQSQANRQQESPKVGRLILLYVDDAIEDTTLFGSVRRQALADHAEGFPAHCGSAFLRETAQQLALRWQAVDKVIPSCKKNLRPLAMAIYVSSTTVHNPWLAALDWMKGVFSRQQTLGQKPVDEIPQGTLPKRLSPHLLVLDEDGKATGIRSDRYEFWVYRQIRNA